MTLDAFFNANSQSPGKASPGEAQPYPIYDTQTGLFNRKQPWIAPRDAWTVLNNGVVFRGQLQKRRGLATFGDLARSLGRSFANGPAAKQFIGKVNEEYLIRGSEDTSSHSPPYHVEFQDSVAAQIGIDDGLGNIVDAPGFIGSIDPAGVNQIDYRTGDFDVTFTVADTLLTVLYNYVAGNQPTLNVVPTEVFNNANAPTTWTGSLAEKPIWRGSALTDTTPAYHIRFSNGPSSFEIWDDGEGNLVDPLSTPGQLDLTATNTIDYETGVFQFTLNSAITPFTALSADYTQFVASDIGSFPVMGLDSFFDLNGNEYLIANDTISFYLWIPSENRWQIISGNGGAGEPVGVNTWTGNDDDFFWYEAYENILVINNGVDRPIYYDPLDLSAFPNGDLKYMGTNFRGEAVDRPAIQSAEMFIRHKNRGVYLYTSEQAAGGGATSSFPQRARFTPVNDIQYNGVIADEAQRLWADAPTEDTIVSAGKIGEEIIVQFTREIWKLVYQGVSGAPFRWEQVSSTEGRGAVAKMGTVEFSEEVATRSRTQMVMTDGIGERAIDEDIPELTTSWNAGRSNYTFGKIADEYRQTLWTVVRDPGDAAFPDGVLVMQYEDIPGTRNWSVFQDFTQSGENPRDPHVMGEFNQRNSVAWDDIDDNWDDYPIKWDDRTNVTGFPLQLWGDRFGRVVVYGTGFADIDQDVTLVARTTRLNPYPFLRANLRHVDIIYAPQADTEITIRIYKDYELAPYLTKTFTETGGGTMEKHMKRFKVGAVGLFHAIELEVNGDKSFDLDAIVPWFKPAGTMREISPTASGL